ncbi:MAG: hypothetical protein AB8H80_19090 [Planctomycetota bacterium]
MRIPDWNGHAVNCRHLADGGLHIEMVTPTGGHRLALERVTQDGGAAEVHVVYAPPLGDFVAQVVTTLAVEVPVEQLEGATSAGVWVHSLAAADGAPTPPRLALAVALPTR